MTHICFFHRTVNAITEIFQTRCGLLSCVLLEQVHLICGTVAAVREVRLEWVCFVFTRQWHFTTLIKCLRKQTLKLQALLIFKEKRLKRSFREYFCTFEWFYKGQVIHLHTNKCVCLFIAFSRNVCLLHLAETYDGKSNITAQRFAPNSFVLRWYCWGEQNDTRINQPTIRPFYNVNIPLLGPSSVFSSVSFVLHCSCSQQWVKLTPCSTFFTHYFFCY